MLLRWLAHGLGSAAVSATVSWLCQQINQVKRRSEGGKPDIKPSPGGGSGQNCSGVRRTNQQPPLRGVSADQHADQDLLHIRETRVQSSGPGSCRVFCPTTQKRRWPREAGRRMKARCLGRIENPAGCGSQDRIGELPIYIQTVIVDFLN